MASVSTMVLCHSVLAYVGLNIHFNSIRYLECVAKICELCYKEAICRYPQNELKLKSCQDIVKG